MNDPYKFPQISVVINTYKGASRGFLAQAVQSVLAQTFSDFELILVDDGSPDETEALCRTFMKDPRVIFHKQKNQGPSAARNAGIRLAKANLICFLDDDDCYFPEKLEKQKALFDADPAIGLASCFIEQIDAQGNFLQMLEKPLGAHPYEELFFGNFIATSSVMIKREVFDDVGIFKDHFLRSEDFDLWLRIAKKWKMASCHEPLIRYRVHPQNVSLNWDLMRFFHEYALLLGLNEAPESIKSQKRKIFWEHCYGYVRQTFGIGDFKGFRRMYSQMKEWGPMPLKWRLKYIASYFPKALMLAKRLKR